MTVKLWFGVRLEMQWMMHMTAGAMTLSNLILLYAIRKAVACAFKSPVLSSELYHQQAMLTDLYELPSG